MNKDTLWKIDFIPRLDCLHDHEASENVKAEAVEKPYPETVEQTKVFDFGPSKDFKDSKDEISEIFKQNNIQVL